MGKSYTKREVSEHTGLPPRKVQFYTETGIIIPDIDDAKGKGKNRKYSFDNIIEFLMCKELTDCGVRLEIIKSILKHVAESRKRGQKWWIDRKKREETHEIVYCFIYNPFKSDFLIQFQHLSHESVGHLSDAAGNPRTIQSYTRRKEGYFMVTILELSLILEKVIQNLKI